MIHELVTDGSFIYGDVNQGDEMFKANKTTLANVATAAGTGYLTDSDEMLVDPTDTYVYNLTENTTAVVKRWTTANLTETTCTISDAVTPGLDGMLILPDGSLLVSDCTMTGGLNYFYKVSPSFTYTSGHYFTVSGLATYGLRNNKIYQNGDSLICIGGPFPSTSVIGIYTMPLGDVYAGQPSVSAASNVGNFGATISGTIDTGGLPATVTVYYGTVDGGTTPGNWQHSSAPTTPAQPQGTGAYSLTLTGLLQSTEYYYAVSSATSLGTTWTAATQNFTTGTTMIASFPLMSVLLQICPALIFMALIFGLVFFSVRQSKKPSALNLVSVVFFALTLLVALTMFSQIIILFYNILTT